MFGRHMNYKLGYVQFRLTLAGLNGTFLLMHIVGLAGMHRRTQDPYSRYGFIDSMLPMNRIMTISAIVLGFTQVVFLANFFWSMWKGRKAEQNPWHANTLEWAAAPTPTPHGNFGDKVPVVYRGP